jgi:serine/threonine protein phosphatase PrpC
LRALRASQVGVVATAEVRVHEIDSERDAFLILASDGVWEFIESDEAVEIVGAIFEKGWSAEAATKHLIARAAVEWMQEEGDYRDDITCIVVYLACRAEMVSMRWEDYGIRDDPDDGRAARLSGSGRHAARPQSEQSQRTLIRVEQPTPSELLAAGKPGAAAPAAPAR